MQGWDERKVKPESIYIHSGDIAVWVDRGGLIHNVINGSRSDPSPFKGSYIQNLIIDGFIKTFHDTCQKVRADGYPRGFTCLVNFRGQLELRRCRIMKAGTGLLVLNHKIEYLC